jgi:hypothetical protein
MAMKIAEEKDVSTLKCLFHHKLGMIEDWILFATWANPLAI